MHRLVGLFLIFGLVSFGQGSDLLAALCEGLIPKEGQKRLMVSRFP